MPETARPRTRTVLIRVGATLLVLGCGYLLAALAGLAPLATESLAWNNIRVVAGAAIAGCLMCAVGYGNE